MARSVEEDRLHSALLRMSSRPDLSEVEEDMNQYCAGPLRRQEKAEAARIWHPITFSAKELSLREIEVALIHHNFRYGTRYRIR